MGSKKHPIRKSNSQVNAKAIPQPVDEIRIKLAMEEPWYKEACAFLMVPIIATAACSVIPVFRCEQGLSFLSVVPLTAAFSYGHLLSPRKVYYEKRWQKIMEYHSYILATVKRTLLFAIPTGSSSWVASLLFKGFHRELALVFETATWGLTTGIFICSLILYTEETFKLRKTNRESYKAKLSSLLKWIIPPTVAVLLLAVFKINVLLKLLEGRP